MKALAEYAGRQAQALRESLNAWRVYAGRLERMEMSDACRESLREYLAGIEVAADRAEQLRSAAQIERSVPNG